MEVSLQVLIGVTSIAAVIILAVWSLGWWLRGYLYEIRDTGHAQVDQLEKSIADKYDQHEARDQTRHEQNLTRLSAQDTRLSVIETRLTMFLVRNGHPPAP